MNQEGRIVDMNNDNKEMTREDLTAMHNNVREQVENPARKKKDHIKLSDVWNTQQTIRKIQRQLVEGYSFDKEAMTSLVNSMFGFINGIARPEGKDTVAEEKVEQITE